MTFAKPATKTPPKSQPTHHAYYVVDGKAEGDKGRWIRLGAFFPHDDGQGGTLVLEVMPIASFDGRIVLRTPSPKTDKE